MHWRTSFIAPALLFVSAAYASPPLAVNSIRSEVVVGCSANKDTQELAMLSLKDYQAGVRFLEVKMIEGKCTPYKGLFKVTGIVGHHGPLWVFKIVTLNVGDLFILYDEEGQWSI